MGAVTSSFDLWHSDNSWACGCGEMVDRGHEYAVRLRDNEEMCMECYEEEKGKRG